MIARIRAALAARHEPPWPEGVLPRMAVEVKALARRDRRARRVWVRRMLRRQAGGAL